ncbi:MAG: TIGR04283 family arsenosugar biosynthesis glycosyltransferase [Candidatus Omnitrophica bacterium]|nr:TIGR04283 family arsenosugar biosynthesis glycosyltransferase [Candidatus Omnitrophota bacterium]
MISIIIPVLNEEKILREKKRYYQNLSHQAQLIFVDGGSYDCTVEAASEFGEVIQARTGRAFQKNVGAKRASSDYLLFLHVDVLVNPDSFPVMIKALNNGAVGGCLTMSIDDLKPVFRFYENAVNFRARAFGVIDGDLGLFVRRDVFEQLGGFDELPVMEDLTFARKLKKAGKITVLSSFVSVSSRKWHERGFLETFGLYTLAFLQLWTKIPFFKHPDDRSKTSETIEHRPYSLRA